MIEILTTIVIIGILCSMAVPIGQLMLIREQERSMRETLYATRAALDKFYEYYGHYPVFWEELKGESPPNYTITFLVDAPPVNPFTADAFDWQVETSGTTEFNSVGLHRCSLEELANHNRKVVENDIKSGVKTCGESGCVGYWGIWNIRYPRVDRVAINDTFYSDW